MYKSISFVIVVLLAVGAAFGQNNYETAKRVEQTNKQLGPIKEYVKAIDEFVESQSGPHLVVADVSDYNTAKRAKWVRFDSEEAFEEDGRESYTVAYIWKKDKKIVRVNFTNSSPSGDWVHYVFHTYNPDGSLAKVDRELRTFMGDIIVNRVQFLNANGRTIKFSRSFRDLMTKEPKSEPESFQDIDADVYLKTRKLPFYRLIAG
jgi:hypothetical protein